MASWNPALHPRGALGRFVPSYVGGSALRNTAVGRGGTYVGIKSGAEFVYPSGRGVLVKGIVGYKGSTARRKARAAARRPTRASGRKVAR